MFWRFGGYAAETPPEPDVQLYAHYTISKDNSNYREGDEDLTVLAPAHVSEIDLIGASTSALLGTITDEAIIRQTSIDPAFRYNQEQQALETRPRAYYRGPERVNRLGPPNNLQLQPVYRTVFPQSENKPVQASHLPNCFHGPSSNPPDRRRGSFDRLTSEYPQHRSAFFEVHPHHRDKMSPRPHPTRFKGKRRKIFHEADQSHSDESSFDDTTLDLDPTVKTTRRVSPLLQPSSIRGKHRQRRLSDSTTRHNAPDIALHRTRDDDGEVALLAGAENDTSGKPPIWMRGLNTTTSNKSSLLLPECDIDGRISHLRSQIHDLERAKNRVNPNQWKLVHEVPGTEPVRDTEGEVTRTYFDQPRWKREGITGDLLLTGAEPVIDMESYLERHPEVAFVVYRTYGPDDPLSSHISAIGESDRGSVDAGFPLPTAERIRLVSKDLIEAILEFSKSLPPFQGVAWGHSLHNNHTMAAPYQLVFFHEDLFSNMATKLTEPVRSQWEMLEAYVHQALGFEYALVRKHLRQGLITRRFMKYLYRPGQVLRVEDGSSVDAVQALTFATRTPRLTTKFQRIETHDSYDNLDYSSQFEDVSWTVSAQHYNFNSWFDLSTRSFQISLPDANEPILITSLKIYPIEYASPVLQRSLEERGKSFWKCRHRRFVEYTKGGGLPAWSGMKSRYMIDNVTYFKMHPKEGGSRGGVGTVPDQEQCPDYPFPVLLPRTIKGYNFNDKTWLEMEIEFIKDVKWNLAAFKNLVFDEETKDILEALVTHQLSTEESTDLIEGKGNGLIILLHGGPGTGKTYTAESVADYAKKPLYRVTCGDIGTQPVDVEKYLETVLRLGRIWNCVILLDEADVFLEERSLNDLQRNALVSVFLRVLEYYSGILILTTNRVGHFDEAFRSRIQLALHYKSLDVDQRTQIWTNFIKNLKASENCEIDFDDLVMHIRDLSEHPMNGRQIRNIITTARQLAEFRKKSLNYAILKKVILITGKFDEYLRDVKRAEQIKDGIVDDEIARDFGNR